MNALVEINLLRKAAKTAGIMGYNKMKLAELRTLGLTIEEPTKVKEDDPFDDIDPEVEGDHLADTSEEGRTAQVTATREAWLLAAVDLMRGMLKQAGGTIPPKVYASVGFPSSNVRNTRGQCFHGNERDPQIFVSPLEDDTEEVLAILVHEAIHACPESEVGHGKAFGAIARPIGLEGKLTATVASDTLKVTLKEIADELGPYPHVKLNLAGVKKQTTRLLKVWCPKCQSVPIRLTKKNADALPYCGSGCTETVYIDIDEIEGTQIDVQMPVRMVFADGEPEEGDTE